jgi:hypothetical protein
VHLSFKYGITELSPVVVVVVAVVAVLLQAAAAAEPHLELEAKCPAELHHFTDQAAEPIQTMDIRGADEAAVLVLLEKQPQEIDPAKQRHRAAPAAALDCILLVKVV